MLSGLVAALSLATTCTAQVSVSVGGCPPLGTDVTSAVELSEQQVAQVKAFVECWSGVLNGEQSTPAEVERARDELARHFNQPGGSRLVSPNFRGTFARFAVPEMERALGSNNMYRAINAVIVLSQLGSDRASNLLLLHVDQQNQAAWQIRLRAAEGERLLLTGASLDARKTLDAARKLRDAILREDNGLVLRSQLAALDAADTTALTPPDRTTLRSLIGESIASVAQRAAAAAQVSGPMVTAMGSAVGTLRVRITTYAKNEQQSIGAQLGPALGKMLEWARANWDDVKKDPLIDNDMRTFVAAAEGLLQFFDTVLVEGKRPAPTSDMRGAWDAGDKPKFETGVKAWQGVLDKAPYKP